MTGAAYKALCIDAVDHAAAARFWAAVLGLEVADQHDGWIRLQGPTPEHTVQVNKVPEPITVKQRVHPDVVAGSVDDVLRLGAEPVDLESFPWKVCRDPGGGELCVFERAEVPAYRLRGVVVDAHEPERIAMWWADLLGGHVGHHEQTYWVEEIPGVPFAGLVFVPVPEPKTVKNRVHWDVRTSNLALVTGDGATLVREQDDEIGWTVLADPEGNEFCAFLTE